MNMNDQEWNDIWDEEPDEDDEFNDFGSDVDANNDETFDNAAEWNEDEHEELIARDSILSHTIGNNNNSNSRSANHRASDSARTVNQVNFVTGSSSNDHNIQRTNASNSSASNGNRNAGYCFLAAAEDNTSAPFWNSNVVRSLFPTQTDPGPSDMNQVLKNAERYIQSMSQSQQERELPEQNQNFRGLINRGIEPHKVTDSPKMSGAMGERILTVDELEKQLLRTSINQNRDPPRVHPAELSKRAGWSPFGGKELFTAQEQQLHSQLGINAQDIAHVQMALPLNVEQQRQIFIQQQQQQQQQMLQQHQQLLLQQMSMMKQQQIQAEQRLMAQNPSCFTVEELERQLLANRSTKNQTQDVQKSMNQNQNQSDNQDSIRASTRVPDTPERPTKPHNRATNANLNTRRRDGDRSDRHEFDRHDRDERGNRTNNRERRDQIRDNHRENHRDNHREYRQRPRGPMIVPPQVQLSVIEKGKHLHPLASTQGDEFLQDRVPTMKDGFLMKRHSAVARSKSDHDGVLTEKERKWLIQIQEKIQADYDDNMDQDYYYLLYFNRTSLTNENPQKSRGPGVPDRRFIPRERLLYDSST